MKNMLKQIWLSVCCLLAVVGVNFSQRPQLVPQLGHPGSIEYLTFSPDGKLLASEAENVVKFWDSETGNELRSIIPSSGFNKIAFSPDGKILAANVLLEGIILYDVASGKELRRVFGKQGLVVNDDFSDFAFSPNGKLLYTATRELVPSPKNSKIAKSNYTSVIAIYDVTTGAKLKAIAGSLVSWSMDIKPSYPLTNYSYSQQTLALSSDGKVIARTTPDKKIRLFNLATGAFIRSIDSGPEPVKKILFSPDGKLLAISTDKATKIVRATTGDEVRVIEGEVKWLEFLKDNKTLLIGSMEGILGYDVNTQLNPYSIVKGHPGDYFGQFAINPDGKNIAVTYSSEGTISLRDFSTGREKIRLDSSSLPINASALTADGNLLIFTPNPIKRNETTNNNDNPGGTGSLPILNFANLYRIGTVSIWDSSVGGIVRKFDLDDAENFGSWWIGYSVTRNTIAISVGGGANIYEVGKGKLIKKIRTGFMFNGPTAFSPDGKIIAVKNKNHIFLWDVDTETGTAQADITLKNQTGVSVTGDDFSKMVFSPDSKTLAVNKEVIDIEKQSIYNPPFNDCVIDPNLWDSRMITLDGKILNRRLTMQKPDIYFNSYKICDLNTGKLLHEIKRADGLFTEMSRISPDGELLCGEKGIGSLVLFNFSTGQELKLKGHTASIRSITFSPDSKLLYTSSGDTSTKIWDTKTGQELASLFALSTQKKGEQSSDWLVVTPDGLFDGTPVSWSHIIWRFSDNIFDVAPVEYFFNEFFYPGLLKDIINGKRPQAKTDIAKLDRRPPKLSVGLINPQPNKDETEVLTRTVTLQVSVAEAPSGARDVRLFRNGSLVKSWPGEVQLDNQGQAMLTATVPIMAGENRFTVYAFNRDNIKSPDVELFVTGAKSLTRKGTVYILALGVNDYQNINHLNFAVSDAAEISNQLQDQQQRLGIYASTEVIALTDAQATRENILLALKRFESGAPNELPENTPPQLQRIKPAAPEDAILIFFAGHGTARGERFYLLPRDFDPANLEKSAVSDLDLNSGLEKVDAGRLLLIIDACQSGQALGQEKEGRGPMNSKGLAQLAYDKGMYVLTAAQSYQAALEAVNINGQEIKHGLLTFSLLDGLTNQEADKDGNQQLWEREWLDYATNQVPLLQLEAMKQRHLEIEKSGRGSEIIYLNGDDSKSKPEDRKLQTPRVFYRRETETNPLIIAKP